MKRGVGAGVYLDRAVLHDLALAEAAGIEDTLLVRGLLQGEVVEETANLVIAVALPPRPDDWTLLVVGSSVLTLAPFDELQLEQLRRRHQAVDKRGVVPPARWRREALDGTVRWELWNVRVRQLAGL